ATVTPSPCSRASTTACRSWPSRAARRSRPWPRGSPGSCGPTTSTRRSGWPVPPHPTRSPDAMTRRPSIAVALLGVAAACGGGDDGGGGDADDTAPATTARFPATSEPDADLPAIVFSGQGNDLVAYSTEPPFESQRVITNATDD